MHSCAATQPSLAGTRELAGGDMNRSILVGALVAVSTLLSACAMTSDVMDMGGGVYTISGRASPIRGGATGATQVAYSDANKFCAKKQPRTHAVLIDQKDRDIYQSSVGGSWNNSGGSFGGGTFAAGSANLRFRCGY